MRKNEYYFIKSVIQSGFYLIKMVDLDLGTKKQGFWYYYHPISIHLD